MSALISSNGGSAHAVASADIAAVRTATDPAEWDRFVSAASESTAYHRWAWAHVIGDTFGHEVRMLSVDEGGRIAGVLPLVIMRSRVFGRFVVSLPFLNFGGVVSDSPSATASLVGAAVEIAKGAGARYLELRHTRARSPLDVSRTHKVGMKLTLRDTADAQWQALDRKVRNQVRKGEKSHLACAAGGAELVDEFYEVFARNMRDLGTPVFPAQLFASAVRAFPGETEVFCVRHRERPVAGAVVHRRGDWCEVIWASALREFNPMSANVFLYWHVIQAAIGHGVRTFEFGRCTPGEGTFHFKQQWGAEAYPLVWEYWMAPGVEAFDTGAGKGRFARAVAIWRRVPLPVATRLGPRLVRGIPC